MILTFVKQSDNVMDLTADQFIFLPVTTKNPFAEREQSH